MLYAYRCLSHPFTAWMQQEAAALSVASGYGGHTRVPSAEGEHPQWQFATLGAYAFLIETHTEFQPSYASALTEAATVWPGILSVLERPISVSGHVTDAATGAPLAAKVELLGRRVLERRDQQQRRGVRLVPHVPPAGHVQRPVLARRVRACGQHASPSTASSADDARRPVDARSPKSSRTRSRPTRDGRETRAPPTPRRSESGSAATRSPRPRAASSS